jgi:hypothetical protein
MIDGIVIICGGEKTIFHVLTGGGRLCGLLSAKGGLMMGTKKVGVLSSPQKKTNIIIFKKKKM